MTIPTCVNCGKRHEGEWCPAVESDCSTDALPMFTEVVQPTFVSVDQEILRAAVIAIANGIETTVSMLTDHDASLGRTTRKNRQWAETLEDDIRAMRRVKHNLRSALGWPDQCDSIP